MIYGQQSKRERVDSMHVVFDTATENQVKLQAVGVMLDYYMDRDIDSARMLTNVIKDISAQSDNPLYQSHVLYQLSSFHYLAGEYDTAVHYAEQAAQGYTKLNFVSGIANARSNMGLALKEKGQLSASLEEFKTILHISDSMKIDHMRHQVSLNMALIYTNLRQRKKATEILESIVNAPNIDRKSTLYLVACNNLAANYADANKTDASKKLSYEALSIAKELDYKIQYPRTYINLATCYALEGKLDSASIYVEQAIKYNEPIDNKYIYMRAYSLAGEINFLKNNKSAARDALLKGLELAKETNTLDMYVKLYGQLAELERNVGNFKLGEEYLEAARYWRDSSTLLQLANEIATSETKYKTAAIELENIRKDKEIESLNQKKRFNNLLFLLASALTVLGVIIYILRSKQLQSKKLTHIEQSYAQSTVKQLEEIKREWAEKLHDDVGQDLVLAQQALEREGASQKSQQSLDAAISKIRSISQQEYPHLLKFIGLKGTIEKLIDEIEQSSPLIISESIDNIGNYLQPDQAIHLYRILQELLKNTLKHGSAASTSLILKKYANTIEVKYEDNGTPFNFHDNLASGHSLGLKQISDRFKILDADVKHLPTGKENNRYHFFINFE